jgi:deoxyribonuclease-4
MGLTDPAGMRLGERDRDVSLAFADRLIRTDFIETFALDPPPAFVKLEHRGRVAIGGEKLEWARIELNADQREQAPCLPVTSPENIVLPMCRFPSLSQDGIGLADDRDKPGFQPLAMLMKQQPGVIDVHVFDEMAKRPPQNQPSRDEANPQDAGTDKIFHGRISGDFANWASGFYCRIETSAFASDGSFYKILNTSWKPMVRTSPGRDNRKVPCCKFGAHMSIAGGFDRAVWAAHELKCETVQLFTKNNNQWRAAPATTEQVAAFQSALSQTAITNPIAHTSYLINLGSPDAELWEKSIDAMLVEVERCQRLGIADLVVHPGAHMGSGEDAGLARIAKALDEVHCRAQGANVTIDLETTAGQGTSLGHRFEHLQGILERVAQPDRLGVCADTCHIFAAGYSLNSPAEYDETIGRLEECVGLSRVRVWHVNDSQRECGSRVDRHAGIGSGLMGLAPFRCLVNDPRFWGVPMILETPKGIENGESLDERNLRTLRKLVRRSRSSRRNG